MKKQSKLGKFVYWTPRVLAILFVIFISMLALDVFGQGYTFWETVLALFMHLIPTLVLIIAIVIAWKNEAIGGLIFIAVGIVYLILFCGSTDLVGYLIIAGPIFLTAILFLLNRILDL